MITGLNLTLFYCFVAVCMVFNDRDGDDYGLIALAFFVLLGYLYQ